MPINLIAAIHIIIHIIKWVMPIGTSTRPPFTLTWKKHIYQNNKHENKSSKFKLIFEPKFENYFYFFYFDYYFCIIILLLCYYFDNKDVLYNADLNICYLTSKLLRTRVIVNYPKRKYSQRSWYINNIR